MEKNIAMKNWHKEDQPREKLLEKGASSLSIAELLAILINTGTREKSALEIAKELYAVANHNLISLSEMDINSIKMIKGLGDKKAVTLVAALELGNRRQMQTALRLPKLNSSRALYNTFFPYFQHINTEHFYAIFLNQKLELIAVEQISSGGLTSTIVDPRVIFNKALQHKKVTSFVVAHNHPSGDPTPSLQDVKLTERLREGAKILELRMIDHIILGADSYYSFADDEKF
jgi:DNA repair protein RadC